jgi:hypothetical protein
MRLGSKEYRQFVGIARGSAGEVCYQLPLARDLKYISNETYRELRTGYDRVVQMLSRLSQSLADEPGPRSRRWGELYEESLNQIIRHAAFAHFNCNQKIAQTRRQCQLLVVLI